MSSLIINFPDCAEVASNSSRDSGEGTITVTADQCQPPDTVIPPMFGSWEIAAFIIVGLAVAIGFTFVRYQAHEMKPKRLEQKRLAEKDKLDAQVAIAQAHKKCDFCQGEYKPEISK
jgi:hypothetical protein